MRLADLPPDSSCLRIVVRRYWERWRWHREYVRCGLLWHHPGPCVPFTPGDYLPLPTLHPLDALAWPFGAPCPLCGMVVESVYEDYVTAFRGDHANWDRCSTETQLTFEPCKCEVRILNG